MKIPCPSCAQQLNLPDRFAGKVTKCPACQQSFEVPPLPESEETKAGKAAAVTTAAAAAHSNMAPVAAGSDELALNSLMEEKKQEGPATLTTCPSCGLPWKKDSIECKCRYNVYIGGKSRKPPARKLNINIDAQQVFLYAFIAAVLYGGYWLYYNGASIKRQGDKAFDDASHGHVDDQAKEK